MSKRLVLEKEYLKSPIYRFRSIEFAHLYIYLIIEATISKAQKEVWEWKEKAYEELKHLSTAEQIAAIH